MPVEVARIAGVVLKVVKMDREYKWHVHPEGDELFYVLEGEIEIKTQNGVLNLRKGEGTIVPKDTPHKTKSKGQSLVLLIEPSSMNSFGIPVEL